MAHSVIVAGYVDDGLGIGAAARGYAAALAAAGCEVAIHAVPVPTRPAGSPPPDVGPADGLPRVGPDERADAVVCCIHPPELARYRIVERRLPTGRACIGAWVYEADPAPVAWRDEATRFDELWAPSPYAARLLRDATGRPARSIPHPMELPARRDEVDPDGPVLVLADGWSSLVRKNVAGAVTAYRKAVRPDAGRRLVVKLWNAGQDPAGLDAVRRAAAGRPDIELIDRFLDRDDYLCLLGSASCLLSLHRAEGFGLALFEALALGVPVVCSEGTGPGEYLAGGAASLVRAERRRVSRGVPGYDRHASWLDPDLDDAAVKLAAVLEDPVSVARAAREPARQVLEGMQLDSVGRSLRDALDAVVDAGRPHRHPVRPAVTVVAHAPDGGAGSALFEAVAPELIAGVAELVLGIAPAATTTPDHPAVRVVRGPSTSPFDLRLAALAEADGDLVILTEDHCSPGPGWIRAYLDAHRTWPAAAYCGPIEAGATTATPSDWANYLVGFVPWAEPLPSLPTDRAPTPANVAVDRRMLEWLGTPEAGTVERELLPALWRAGAVRLVRGAAVCHEQSLPLHRHLANHFRDSRTAGAHARRFGARRHSLLPHRILGEARAWTRSVDEAIAQGRPSLLGPRRRARRALFALGIARSTGMVVGSWLGAGRAAERLA